MIIKYSIPDFIRDAILEEENAKKYVCQIADWFITSQKVETSTLLKGKNELLMSLLLIVWKRKRSWNKKWQKVLIW